MVQESVALGGSCGLLRCATTPRDVGRSRHLILGMVCLLFCRHRGFGSLADVSLQPGPLTVLIGPNGAGKSNLLRALRMVSLMRTGSLQRFVAEAGGASALLHYGPKRTPVISLKLEFDLDSPGHLNHTDTDTDTDTDPDTDDDTDEHAKNWYEARLGFAAGDRLMYLDELVGYQSSKDRRKREWSLGAGHWESVLRDEAMDPKNTTVRTANHCIRGLTFFHFHDTSMTSALRTKAWVQDDRFLRSDGSNLAAFLRRLQQSEHDDERTAWRRINQFVRRIVPAVKMLDPTMEGAGSVRLDWVDDRDQRFGVHQLSDGTLRSIALITALAQPTHLLPMFVSIDEPELGLHPAAIHLLAELARSVSRHTQVLFATQSTSFLDHFEPHEVVVVERDGGKSQLKPVDGDALASWLEDYRLSEIFGKGVIGGRP
ncbi:MAG TPA: ATP-binding cassette domain-containing protein [Nannocystis exedens]|nr:ATP-binding cassette domain-containing protein [Nannocystis exedens]